MKYAAAILIVLVSSAASAECLHWGMTVSGYKVCVADDLLNRNPIMSVMPGPGGAVFSSSPQPKCEEGWSLVLSTGMSPMCARELRAPK